MKFSTKDIALIAVTVALTVILGWIIYVIANLFPVPGSKFVGVTVFSSFMIYFPVYKLKRRGVYLGVTAPFAIIMSFISIFMGLAIIASGLMTEILGWFLIKDYSGWRTIIVTGFFSFFGTLNSLLVTYYLTGLPVGNPSSLFIPFLFFIFISLLGGSLGAFLANYLLKKYFTHLDF